MTVRNEPRPTTEWTTNNETPKAGTVETEELEAGEIEGSERG